MTVYFFYRGWSPYLSSDSKRELVGIGMMITGVLLAGYSYIVITGYITTPGFESNP
ncbi:hypothetical protein [Haladaptatus litoreus]|uniref:hypothetical protein n=1 Tax=Haladaptatus litoreus TaxID=553468 RepID=UPI00158B725E|nr:hypothetical protein [Haladaptatus litoreus]